MILWKSQKHVRTIVSTYSFDALLVECHLDVEVFEVVVRRSRILWSSSLLLMNRRAPRSIHLVVLLSAGLVTSLVLDVLLHPLHLLHLPVVLRVSGGLLGVLLLLLLLPLLIRHLWVLLLLLVLLLPGLVVVVLVSRCLSLVLVSHFKLIIKFL